jgi:hypothetical protein
MIHDALTLVEAALSISARKGTTFTASGGRRLRHPLPGVLVIVLLPVLAGFGRATAIGH